jgi:uncharacterized tellurite resistance protein B-like protein
MNTIHTQLKTLVQLALVDDNFDESEEKHILAIGKANKLEEDEIREIIDQGLRNKKKAEKLDYSLLNFDQKFEYLYNIVQLMKIDHEVYLSEIRYCERTAERLGFDKKVISQMSTEIYSDPKITTDREKLKQKVKKYIS